MGLLSKVVEQEKTVSQPENYSFSLASNESKDCSTKQTSGFLKSAIKINENTSYCFPNQMQPIQKTFDLLRQFSNKNNIQKFGIISTTELSPETGHLVYSLGLDETTKERFMVDKQNFLDSIEEKILLTIPKENFKKFNLEGLFSNTEYESIISLSIYKIDFRFLMIIDSMLNTSRPNFSNLTESIEPFINIFIKQAPIKGNVSSTIIKKKNNTKVPLQIKSALSKGYQALLLSLSINKLINLYALSSDAKDLELIYQELLLKIKSIIGSSNLICDLGNYNFNIALFSTAKTDSDFYLYQLNKTLHPYTGATDKNYIELLSSLNSDQYQEILNFICCDGENNKL